jgi:hypothetical protein
MWKAQKAETGTKHEPLRRRFQDFELRICFGFRASDFEFSDYTNPARLRSIHSTVKKPTTGTNHHQLCQSTVSDSSM